MKKIIIVLALFLTGWTIQAQDYAITPETPGVFTQYYINPVLLNPAYTGVSGKYRLFLNYRSHWSGHPGAPKAFSLDYNGPAYDKLGFGALLHNEVFGVSNRLRGQLSYAYRFAASDLKMSLGVSTDYIKYGLSNRAITDGTTDPNDPVVLNNLNGKSYFSASIGFYAKFRENLFFGFALPSIINTRIDELATGQKTVNKTNFVANIGTWVHVPGYKLVLEPSLYIKKFGDIPLTIDVNLLASFLDDRLFGGATASFGAGNRFGFLLGAGVNNFRFYYSYDVSFQDFQQYNNGSHELTIALNLFDNMLQKSKNTEMNMK